MLPWVRVKIVKESSSQNLHLSDASESVIEDCEVDEMTITEASPHVQFRRMFHSWKYYSFIRISSNKQSPLFHKEEIFFFGENYFLPILSLMVFDPRKTSFPLFLSEE